jgi:diguanylate cyclase (GGDEF)-like protein/PAS domain S-box-containing protein
MARPPIGQQPDDPRDPSSSGAPSSDRFSLLFRSLPLALALLDEAGNVLDVNPALTELLEQPRDRLRGVPMIELTHPADRPRVREVVAEVAEGERDSVRMQKRLRAEGGPTKPVRVTLLRLEEPGGTHHRLAQIEDLGADDHDQLRREAHEDQLTGVGNRRALQQRLDPLIASGSAATPAGSPSAVVGWSLLFVDLDDFKHVNDDLGHASGDAVLVTVASRLSRLVRDGDLVCRLGGDEFVLLLGTAVPSEVRGTEERIRRSLAQPITVGDVEVRISASVGSAIPQADDSAHDLLARADAAMYRDKTKR